MKMIHRRQLSGSPWLIPLSIGYNNNNNHIPPQRGLRVIQPQRGKDYAFTILEWQCHSLSSFFCCIRWFFLLMPVFLPRIRHVNKESLITR